MDKAGWCLHQNAKSPIRGSWLLGKQNVRSEWTLIQREGNCFPGPGEKK